MFNPSKYQQSIFDWIQGGKGHAVVNAVAGSGKTTTLEESATLLPPESDAQFVAFNTHIVAVLNTRLAGTPMRAVTVHSAGRSALAKIIKIQGAPDTKKYNKIVKAIFDRRNIKAGYQTTSAIIKLVDQARNSLVNPRDFDALMALAARFDILDDLEDAYLPFVNEALKTGETQARNAGLIDFTDMIYLPVTWDLTPAQGDWVFGDECLPYKTPVQLADGTSLMIGDIVENSRAVDVLAYDTQTGQQKACKITKWSKTLNQKPLVKIRVKWIQKRKGRSTNFVVCTTDHKIWADGQWIPAGDIKPGMNVQVETSAIKSQAYKITGEGRETLSAEMTSKNAASDFSHGSNVGGIFKRGGNGKGLTLAQSVLLEALGDGWKSEYPIATKLGGKGYPTAYKVDIANPARKIAIEVDGYSHNSITRKQQDHKKDDLLTRMGWRVFRIPNRRAIQQTQDCLSEINTCPGSDCPIDAVVLSVDPVSIPDNYVYDITVEDCHNFYANGILVHNCQDWNAAQVELVCRMIRPDGRFLGCGDPKQSIMAFAGSDDESFWKLKGRLNAIELPLSVCYRCPKKHVDLARDLVPNIEASPFAIDGIVTYEKEANLFKIVKTGDLILCRKTAPLVSTCIALIGQGIAARVRGRNVGKTLTDLARTVSKMTMFEVDKFLKFLDEYQQTQVAFLAAKEDTEEQIENLNDRCEALTASFRRYYTKDASFDGILAEIEALFSDDNPGVWLSTIHRAKGLEADRVMILEFANLPLIWKNQQPYQFAQELNLKYVALTRAKKELILFAQEPKPIVAEQPALIPAVEKAPEIAPVSQPTLIDPRQHLIAAPTPISMGILRDEKFVGEKTLKTLNDFEFDPELAKTAPLGPVEPIYEVRADGQTYVTRDCRVRWLKWQISVYETAQDEKPLTPEHAGMLRIMQERLAEQMEMVGV